MEKNERAFKADLDQMRKQPENRVCADCASLGTVWASINLGVFLCLRCGSIHRGLGTHVSVPKGCTGTYLWGPDELQSMRMQGNSQAREVYGGDKERPSASAGDEVWKKFIRDKYEFRKFAPSSSMSNKLTSSSVPPPRQRAPPATPPAEEPALLSSQAMMPEDTTEDLISFDYIDSTVTFENKKEATGSSDFFSEFGL